MGSVIAKEVNEFKIHLQELTDRGLEEFWYKLFKAFKKKKKKNEIAKNIFIKKKKLIKIEYGIRDLDFPEKPLKISHSKKTPKKCSGKSP